MAASSGGLLSKLQYMVEDYHLLGNGPEKRDSKTDCSRAGASSILLEHSKTITLPVPPSQLLNQQSPGLALSKVS